MALTIHKYIKRTANEPLAGVAFRIVDGSGTPLNPDGGIYYTDNAGTIVLEGLEPGMTITAQEIKTVDGYALDGRPQSIKIEAGKTQNLTFWNKPAGSLIIRKLDKLTGEPLAGVEFLVTDSTESVVGPNNGYYTTDKDRRFSISGLTPGTTITVRETKTKDGYIFDGGKISSNGLYTTNTEGQIVISGITGTIIATELETVNGYVIDPADKSQTVQVNANDTQIITFENMPIGGLIIVKKDEETGERISGVQFEIRKLNGEIIGTYTTDRNGVISLPQAEKGWYQVTELKAAKAYRLDSQPCQIEAGKGFMIDSTPQYFTVEDGKTTTLTVTNRLISGILIHKIDSTTKEGIYGVTFARFVP